MLVQPQDDRPLVSVNDQLDEPDERFDVNSRESDECRHRRFWCLIYQMIVNIYQMIENSINNRVLYHLIEFYRETAVFCAVSM